MARSMSTLKFEILANAKVAKLLAGKFADNFMLVDYLTLSCLTSSCLSVVTSVNLMNFICRQYLFPHICIILFC